jgi:membrane associated rhomboid family serine protease
VRSATTVFGGRVSETPVVSYTIIAICVLVWLGQRSVPGLTRDIAFVPALGEAQPWRFLTSAFAHDSRSFMHIGFNMLALWVVGAQYLEPLLGRLRYGAVYLLGAFGGSVVYLLMARTPEPPYTDLGNWAVAAVGASGAVFGLFGALLVLNRKLGRSSAGMYATIVINAVIGFVIPGIAWQAHLGGLLTGAAAAGLIALTTSRARRRWQWPGLVALVVLLAVLAAAKYAVAPDLVFG